MNGPSESGIGTDEYTGPASLDSEFDDTLVIPDIVNFSECDKPGKSGTEILSEGECIEDNLQLFTF